MSNFSLINDVIITRGEALKLIKENSYSNTPVYNIIDDKIIIAYFLKVKIIDKYIPFQLFAEYKCKTKITEISNKDVAQLIYEMHKPLKEQLLIKDNITFLIPTVNDIYAIIIFTYL